LAKSDSNLNLLTIIFRISNAIALLGWIAIVFLPHWQALDRMVFYSVVCLLCTIYCYLIFAARSVDSEKPRGAFTSLAGVISLFKTPRVVLAGWVHFLAFDLALGLMIRHDASIHNIPHAILIPVYLLTLLFGPAGVLLYLGLRWFYI
jgi:Domain of unknown function (DUF4281)